MTKGPSRFLLLVITSASLVGTSALLVVTMFASNFHLILIVTTSKALVSTSFLLLPVRHLLLEARLKNRNDIEGLVKKGCPCYLYWLCSGTRVTGVGILSCSINEQIYNKRDNVAAHGRPSSDEFTHPSPPAALWPRWKNREDWLAPYTKIIIRDWLPKQISWWVWEEGA